MGVQKDNIGIMDQAAIRYSPKLSVYLDDVARDDKKKVVGMLRGLFHAIEGWEKKPGIDPDKFFIRSPAVLLFSSVDHAHYYKDCVERYFAPRYIEQILIKKRVYRNKDET